MPDIQSKVLYETAFGFRICAPAHGQIVSENGPIVNIWTNKMLKGRIKFQRCGSEAPARVGTVDDAIAEARSKQGSELPPWVDSGAKDVEATIAIRIGSVTVEMSREDWLKAIADIATKLGARS